MLGVLYAALGAFTFALNNVAMRRGVVTGSVLQGMALTVPIGGLSFLVMTIAFGELHQLVVFPMAALIWLACQGVVHFVVGRYCNYKSNQLMGVNLTAPVVQLQVPFAMMLAVVMLHEKFTVLQAIGSALMLGGSFITQGNAGKGKRKASAPLTAAMPIPTVPWREELAASISKQIGSCPSLAGTARGGEVILRNVAARRNRAIARVSPTAILPDSRWPPNPWN